MPMSNVPHRSLMAQVARSRVANFCFLLAELHNPIAAAAFNGFYDKMGDSSTTKPGLRLQTYSMAPRSCNEVASVFNAADAALRQRDQATPTLLWFDENGSDPSHPWLKHHALDLQYTIRYHMVYYLTFLLLIGALLVMRSICLSERILTRRCAPTARARSFGAGTADLSIKRRLFLRFLRAVLLCGAIWLVMQNRLVAILPLTRGDTQRVFFFFLLALFFDGHSPESSGPDLDLASRAWHNLSRHPYGLCQKFWPYRGIFSKSKSQLLSQPDQPFGGEITYASSHAKTLSFRRAWSDRDAGDPQLGPLVSGRSSSYCGGWRG